MPRAAIATPLKDYNEKNEGSKAEGEFEISDLRFEEQGSLLSMTN